MKTLYLESIAGIAGDMFTASFVDAGLVKIEELQNLCHQLNLPNVQLIMTKTMRSHISATHLEVKFEHHSHQHIHTSFSYLNKLFFNSALPLKTKQLAIKILDVLAEAEASSHGVKKEEVEFHEIGMIDSIMDIVMAAHCIAAINPDNIISSPIILGKGRVTTAHGVLPVPPPVSAALMIGMPTANFPNEIQRENVELSTPTGLAILKSLQPKFSTAWPKGLCAAQGYGAGSMSFESYPNLFRIGLLEQDLATKTSLPYLSDQIIEISTNIDDMSPEWLAWSTQKLFSIGALDVWQMPVAGKKGRIMIVLSVLVEKQHMEECIDFILTKTSTFGLRYHVVERLKLVRHLENKSTDLGMVQVKIGSNTRGEVLKSKPEFEEMRQLMEANKD